MQPVYSHAQLEAFQVPVLEMLTLHAGQLYPLVRVDTRQRQDIADLVWMHRATGPLTLTTQWIGGVPRVPGGHCWLVVEVAHPPVVFALAFTLPAALADLADVAISRTLTLLLDGCPDQAAGASALDGDWLWPLMANSLTLALDATGCARLAQYLVGWSASPAKGERRRWPAN